MSTRPAPAGSADNAIGLKAYLAQLALQVSSVPETWVRAELHSLQVMAKYVRYELVEHGPDGSLAARVAGGCRPPVHGRIVKAFDAVGLEIRAGGVILVAVRAHLAPAYGLQVEVVDVDTRFSQGDLGLRVDVIRDRLRREGCWSLNRDLRRPRDFLRVAVISPAGAAGLGDFQTGVEGLRSHELTTFAYYEVPFQSAEAPSRITAALKSLYEDASAGRLCAVALIRGGGAAADLTWLVDYDLVEAVCRFPVPILVGIGHQRDSSLLDEVATVSGSTPTAIADHIRSTVCSGALAASDALRDMNGQGGSILARLNAECREAAARAFAGARSAIRECAPLLDRHANSRSAAISFLAHAQSRVAAFSAVARTDCEAARVVASAQVASSVDAARTRARASLHEAELAVAACAVGHSPLTALRDAEGGVSAASAIIASGVAAELRRPDAGIALARVGVGAACVSAHAAAAAALSSTSMTVTAYGRTLIASAAVRVERSVAIADSVRPQTVLAGGYALLRDEAGKPITRVAGVQAATLITAELRDGLAHLINHKPGAAT